MGQLEALGLLDRGLVSPSKTTEHPGQESTGPGKLSLDRQAVPQRLLSLVQPARRLERGAEEEVTKRVSILKADRIER